MSFRIHSTATPEVLDAWTQLAAQHGTRFASRPSYGMNWLRVLGKGSLALACVEREGSLVAVLPLHRRTYAGAPVYRLLGHGLGTVGEAIAVDDAALDELVAGLHSARAVLQLTHLPVDAPLTRALRRHPGYAVTETPDDHCPVIDLPTGTTARDLRRGTTLRRAAGIRRKLEREGRPLETFAVTTPKDFDAHWGDITQTAAQAEAAEADPRLNLCGGEHAEFTHSFLREEAESGNLLIWGATFGGVWRAHFATLRTGGRAELWFTRFAPDVRSARPGHQMIETLVDAHDSLGITECDLLLGRNQYKTDWQTREYAVATVRAHPRSRAAVARYVSGVERLAATARHRVIPGGRAAVSSAVATAVATVKRRGGTPAAAGDTPAPPQQHPQAPHQQQPAQPQQHPQPPHQQTRDHGGSR